MGADIHLFVETLDDSGEWVPADKWAPNGDYEGPDGGEPFLTIAYSDRFYSERNYDLFAILADVRNGRGFAGVKTGEGFNPIDDPRGLPENVSTTIKEVSNSWGCDGHSHSYFTLRELLDFDWTQRTSHSGWVNGKSYSDYLSRLPFSDPSEGPGTWCGSVFGDNIKQVDLVELKEILEALYETEEYVDANYQERQVIIDHETRHIYAEMKWESPYWMSTRGEFWTKTIPLMLGLAKGDYDRVRIVFLR